MTAEAQRHDGRRAGIVAIDTATTKVVIAIGTPMGAIDGSSTWPAGHRHGETLLPSLGRFMGEQNLRRSRLVGVIVGSGPGAFTGLRVGIATAKGIAHGLGIPLVGVSTAEAIIRSAASTTGIDAGHIVLLLPAGPSDRVAVRLGDRPTLLRGGEEPVLGVEDVLVALDLTDRAPADALLRGEAARDGLGAALIEVGAGRLLAGMDELATLVPDYVTLPRGTHSEAGDVAWSRDPR